jgi:hypothetical protein
MTLVMSPKAEENHNRQQACTEYQRLLDILYLFHHGGRNQWMQFSSKYTSIWTLLLPFFEHKRNFASEAEEG